MNDQINATLFSDEAVEQATKAAHDVLSEQFGMPFKVRSGDYRDPVALQKANERFDAKNDEAVKLVVKTVIATLQENMMIDLAAQVREARAAELEEFAEVVRVPKNRLSDTYTMRTIAETAISRARLIRRGEQ